LTAARGQIILRDDDVVNPYVICVEQRSCFDNIYHGLVLYFTLALCVILHECRILGIWFHLQSNEVGIFYLLITGYVTTISVSNNT
jgi:hypothetical protein